MTGDFWIARTPIKWPRQYAAEVMGERDLEKRRAMLDAVPAHLQAMVKFYVKHGWERRGRVA